MKFFLDEDLPPSAAKIARNQGLDITSVQEEGRHGLSDGEQLEHAASQRRVLVTRNRNDFLDLTRRAFQTNSPHAGVLIVTRSLPSRRPERLAAALVRHAMDGPDYPGSGGIAYLREINPVEGD